MEPSGPGDSIPSVTLGAATVPALPGSKTQGLSKASRVQVGVLVALLFLGCSYWGGWAWSALIFASLLVGQWELTQLLRSKDVKPSQVIIWATTVLMLLVASLDKPQFLPPILTLAVMASFFRLLFRTERAGINDIGGTLLVVFYMVYMPVHMVLLRHLGNHFPQSLHLAQWQQPGFHAVVFLISVIAASDIAAYYVGKAFGKNLLAAAISPKKTQEGAVAGLFAGMLFGWLTTLIWPFPWVHALLLSALLVAVGQLGDLTESMMKRDAGLKDSGELLASHGGFLDRSDSYVFSCAVCYYYMYWVIYRQGLAPEVIHWFRGWMPY
jgi:phosphatidate cytidylyltransferase